VVKASSAEPARSKLSRRSFLAGGGALVAAAALPVAPAALAQLTTPVLAPQRQLTYEALVDALIASELSIVEGSARDAIIQDYLAYYRSAGAGDRAFVDDTLDAFDHGHLPGAFAALSPQARLDRIRVQRQNPVTRNGLPTSLGSLVQNAVAQVTGRFIGADYHWDRAASAF
jgi:hypothetical protein